MSKTGSLTPNLPTTDLLIKLTECLLNPPAYFNKRSKLYSFFNQFQNKLNGNINCYSTPNSQLCYTISHLKKDAADTVYLFQLNTVEELVAILKAFYGDFN